MTTTFDCALNGVLLSSLDESIAVLNILEDAPTMRISTAAAAREGFHLLGSQRERLCIHVDFAIHEPDTIRRRQTLQAVFAWAANGGTLTTSDHPGQQLTVICSAYPAMEADNWLSLLTITFSTTTIPYWETADFVQTICSGDGTLTVPGNAPYAPVSVMIVNYGPDELTSLTLVCGKTQMIFENISLPVNEMLSITQLGPILTARIGNESALHCRTAESDDSLLAPCGQECTVQVIAAQEVEAIFLARGRFA